MRPLALIVVLLLAVASAGAQTADGRVYRLGVLAPSAASMEITRATTLAELARLGFNEGSNLVVDEGVGVDTLPHLARRMVQAKPDAIFAIGPEAARAAREATATVPVVVFMDDPVAAGYAESRAHPGGNITGVGISAGELDGKRLDLLHEAAPEAHRVAALLLTSLPDRANHEQPLREVAGRIGLDLLSFDAAGPQDYPAAFAAMRAARAEALIIQANAIFYRDAAQLAALALETGLPTVCEWAEMARSGCLLGYGPSRTELRRRNGEQIARIFRGAAPGDLPIETATRFDFSLNARTAKALGLTVPQSILARADEVIE